MHSYVRDGLVFDVSDAGPDGGRVVIALHGFADDRRCWSSLSTELTARGYRVLAPDQRGYSPGAKPHGRRAYTTSELAADVLALADTAGARRFDVIGHDWGAVVAWELAGRHGARVRSLTALSVPHPRAVRDALWRSRQLLQSWRVWLFQVPAVPEWALRQAGRERVTQHLVRGGLDPQSAARLAARIATRGAMTGPVNWYRAVPLSAISPVGEVEVPTLFVWGDRDQYVTRAAASRTRRYVTGPYRFEVVPGAGHWLPTTAVDRVAPLVLDHLEAVAD